MKKICFLIGNLNNAGGTEKVTTVIANTLSENHCEVFILNLSEGDDPYFLLSSNIKIYSLFDKKISFKSNFLSVVYKIRNFVKDNDIHTFIVVDSISCIFTIPALFGLKIKHICWEHFNFKNNNGTKLRDLARKFAARYCDVIVTLTEKDKALWLKNLKTVKAKINVIPNPIINQIADHNRTRQSKIVLSVGRLVEVKGFDLLLKAWTVVVGNHADWKLNIVGSGEDEVKLKELAYKLNIEEFVIFTKAVKDVEEYYLKSSFYCLSSRFEGFPMVLLEAQSCGMPIVAFDCDTGPAEIVSNNVNGFLVEPLNIDDLATKISSMILLSDLEFEKMSKNAYDNSKKFNIDSICEKWLGILSKV